MSRFVLIVDLEVKPEGLDTFLEAVRGQVEQTVCNEPGCYQFDIIRSADDRTKFTHYESFENEAAFQAHTTMPHTLAFRDKVESLLLKAEMRSGELFLTLKK